MIYVLPLCIKFQCVLNSTLQYALLTNCLRHDILYACFLLLGILSIFKAYPTLSDPGLFLSMLSLFPETFPRTSGPLSAPGFN